MNSENNPSDKYLACIVQINLMMSGKHPVEAMSLIRDLGLFDVVFAFPKTSDPPGFDNCDRCVLVLTSSYFVFQIQATVCTQFYFHTIRIGIGIVEDTYVHL
jgi:hypothetical protein